MAGLGDRLGGFGIVWLDFCNCYCWFCVGLDRFYNRLGIPSGYCWLLAVLAGFVFPFFSSFWIFIAGFEIFFTTYYFLVSMRTYQNTSLISVCIITD